MANRNEYMEGLIKKINKGDAEATKELIKLFEPLIYKISQRIYYRYGKCASINAIIAQARNSFLHITLIDYIPNGKAKYPYFIKKKLHAKLVQVFRPIFQYYKNKSEPDWDHIVSPKPNMIIKHERTKAYELLLHYVDTEFTEREKDIVYQCICNGTPRQQMAKKYNISVIRMQTIYRDIIRKLQICLKRMGIRKLNDI